MTKTTNARVLCREFYSTLSNKKTLSLLPGLQKHLIFQLLKTIASMSIKSNEGENSLTYPHFSSTHDH